MEKVEVKLNYVLTRKLTNDVCLPNTMRLLLILLASSKVFPSLIVFLVISLPARSTKLIFPVREINTPPSVASSDVICTVKIVWLRLEKNLCYKKKN